MRTEVEETMLREVVERKIDELKRSLKIANPRRADNIEGRLLAYKEMLTMLNDKEMLEYLWDLYKPEN